MKRVTPYTVLVGDSQDVRFAVELKGNVGYSLHSEGNVVTLVVENQQFGSQPGASSNEVLPLPVPAAAPVAPAKPAAAAAPPAATPPTRAAAAAKAPVVGAPPGGAAQTQVTTGILGATPPKTYTGQKILSFSMMPISSTSCS